MKPTVKKTVRWTVFREERLCEFSKKREPKRRDVFIFKGKGMSPAPLKIKVDAQHRLKIYNYFYVLPVTGLEADFFISDVLTFVVKNEVHNTSGEIFHLQRN